MAQDTSFLSQLQRSEGDDYIEYRIYSDRTREGEDAHEITAEGGVSSTRVSATCSSGGAVHCDESDRRPDVCLLVTGTDVLEEVRAAIMAMASVLLKDHIWHREGFALEVVQGQSGHGGNHEVKLTEQDISFARIQYCRLSGE
jgi:hypothetical protein